MELVGKLMPGAAVFTTDGTTDRGWAILTSQTQQSWATIASPTEAVLEAGTYLVIWVRDTDGPLERLIGGTNKVRGKVTIAGGSHTEIVSDTAVNIRLRIVGSHSAAVVILRL